MRAHGVTTAGGSTRRRAVGLRWLLALAVVASVLVQLQVAGPATAAAEVDETNLSRTGNESTWNRVATSDDDVYVVWQDRSYNVGGAATIVMRRSDDKGADFQPTQWVSSGRADAVHPAVAAAGSRVYVAWQQLDASIDTHRQNDIWLAISDNHGATFDVRRVSNDAADSIDPAVVADGDDLAVVWNDSDGRILAATSADGGETLRSARIADHAGYGTHLRAAMALGTVYAAWQNGMHAAVARLEQGATTGDAVQDLGRGWVDGLAAWGLGVHVLVDTDGLEPGAGLEVVSSTDAGATWLGPVLLDPNKDGLPGRSSIAADGGEVAVAWTGALSGAVDSAGVPTALGVFVARSANGGRSFGQATLASSDARGAFTDIDLAALTHTDPGRKPSPALTWTVPKRFGNDADRDGLVDYVTTADEVLDQTYPVDLDACASGGGDSAIVSYEWQVDGETTRSTSCRLRHEFDAQGTYDVGLSVTTADGDTEAMTFPVTVKDLLVVSIGDSVASGEGNPDIPGPGTHFWQRGRWEMKRCHRSAAAGPALAARRLEDADPQTSVTFLHLACSGATISEPDPKSGGVLTPYEGIDNEDDADPMLPQLEQLRDLITRPDDSRRSVDAMFMSIGANDLKFSDVIRACMGGDCTDADAPVRAELDRRKAQLPGRYDDLAHWLRSYVPADRTFLTEYFDPTSDDSSHFDLRCVGPGDLITDVETGWAYDNVVTPLNRMGREAADRNGWHYVGGLADAFEPHGYCANDSWVVQLGTSIGSQGGIDGAFHPNGAGHQVYGRRIAAEAEPVLGLPDHADPAADVRSHRFAVVYSGAGTTLTVAPLDGSEPTTVSAPYHPITGGLRVGATDVGVDVTWISYLSGPGAPGDGTTAPYEVFGRHVRVGPGGIDIRSVQVVQAPSDATALVAGKSAVLRVEIFNGLDDTRFVPLTYGIGPDGSEQTGTVQVGLHRGRNVVWVRPSPAYLPTTGQVVTPRASIATEQAHGGVSSMSGPPLPVRSSHGLSVLYAPVAGPDAAPSCAAVRGVARDGGSFAAAAYPVADGELKATVTCATSLRAQEDDGTVDLVETLRSLESAARTTGFDAVVGVVPQGWFAEHTTERLNGGVGFVGGDHGPVEGASIVEAGAPAPAVAHELGHNLGLGHSDDAAAGYRFDQAEARAGDDLMDPVANPQNWIADGTFQMLRSRLQAVSSLAAATGGSLLVSGVLHDDGTASAAGWQLTDEAPDPAPASSDLNVVMRDAGGDVTTIPIGLAGAAGLSDATVSGGRAFAARVPWHDGTVAVDLVDADGRTLLSRPVSPAAPTVTVTAPSAGDRATVGDVLPFRWDAQDADGDALTADVALSTDGGTTWRPVATGVTTGSADVPVTAELAGRDVTLRVVVSDGVNTTTRTAPVVTVRGGGVGNGNIVFSYNDDRPSAPPYPNAAVMIGPDGSRPRTVAPRAYFATFSPDGTRLAWVAPYDYPGEDRDWPNLFLADADGSNAHPFYSEYHFVTKFSFSPDGRQIVMESCAPVNDVSTCGIWIVPLDGGAPRLVRADPSGSPDLHDPVWSPDGVHIAYESHDWVNNNTDIRVVRTDGTGDVNISRNLPYNGVWSHDQDPAWSPDGSRIAFEFSNSEGGLAVMDADGRNMQLIVRDGSGVTEGAVRMPTWSPDGSRIAFSLLTRPEAGREWAEDIYTVRPDGSDRQQLTHYALRESAESPSWQAVPQTGADDPEPTVPPLSAGGPYSAVAGRPVTLAAGLTGADSVPLLAWDLDDDGAFDDAEGVSPTVAFDAAGSHHVVVRATEADGTTRTAGTTVDVVAPAPVVDAGPDQVATAGASYSLGGATFAAPATGGYHATVDWGDGDSVDARVERAADGHFLVVAARTLDAGTHHVTVTVCDDDGRCGSDSTSVEADPDARPAVVAISPEEGTRGTTVTVRGDRLGGVTAVRFGTHEVTEVERVSDHELHVVAPALTDGERVPVTVTSLAGPSTDEAAPGFVGHDQPPVVSVQRARTNVGTPVELDLTATDPDGDDVVLTVHGQPAHGTAVVTASGTVRYTPEPGFGGADQVDVVADDGLGGVTPVVVGVAVGSRAPLARTDVLTATERTLRVPLARLLANDADPDGDELHVADVTAVEGTLGTVEVDGDELVYRAGATPGPDTLEYRVSDSTGMTTEGEIAVEPATTPGGGGGGGMPDGTGSTALTYRGPEHVQYSDPLAASVHLADATGAPVRGAVVSVTADGATVRTPATDADGDATVSVPLLVDPGALAVGLAFAGDASHAASAGEATVVVDREDCTLTGVRPRPARAGRPVELVARFGESDDTPGDPAEHTVRFVLTDGSGATTTIRAQTDAAGRAVVTPTLPAGVYRAVETFAGDGRYLPCAARAVFTSVARPGAKVVADGSVRTDAGRALVGLTAGRDGHGPWGQLQLVTLGGGRHRPWVDRFQSGRVTSLTSTGSRVSWTGTGSWNGRPGFRFTATVAGGRRHALVLVVKDPQGRVRFGTHGYRKLRGHLVVR